MGRPSTLAGALTARQLAAALAAFPRLSEHGRDAAHRVLVAGDAPRQVAEDIGVSLQMVSRWVRQVYAQHCPPGWERRVVVLPPTLMKEVERMEQQARTAFAQAEEIADAPTAARGRPTRPSARPAAQRVAKAGGHASARKSAR